MGMIDRASKITGKPGYYDVYEGYQEDQGGPARLVSLARAARKRARAAMAVEALTMGAIGLTVGVAVGAALALKLGSRRS
jgi:hypothetical protein